MIEWDKVLEFNNKHFPGWKERPLIFYSNALAGEVGEICNNTKKVWGGGTNRECFQAFDLAAESVDVFIYLVLFLETIGVDRETFRILFERKMKILESRMENRQ